MARNDKSPPPCLEVCQRWGDLALETRHYADGKRPIRATSSVRWRWSVLGVPMASVTGPLRWLARVAPPLISEVETDPDAGWFVPDGSLEGSLDHDLFTWQGDHYDAHLQGDWTGTVTVDGRAMSVDEAVATGHATRQGRGVTVPVRAGVDLSINADAVAFDVRQTPAPRSHVGRDDEPDLPFIATLAVGLFTAATFAAMMWTAPPVLHTVVAEDVDRFVELALQLPPEPIEPERALEVQDNEEAAPEEGSKAPEPEGKRGKRDAADDTARAGRDLKRADREVVGNAGIFATDLDGGLFETSALASDLADSIGLHSGPKGVARGPGLGRRGPGFGGGGGPEGLGGFDLHGNGPGGNPDGDGAGDCRGDECLAKDEGGFSAPGPGPIIGNIDRSLIKEVVDRHMSQIRYCYQRELQRQGGLGGTVVVKFTIATDGTVSSAATKESTMNHAAVESCINGRFMRMVFPPLPHGIAIVSYPFHFSPGS